MGMQGREYARDEVSSPARPELISRQKITRRMPR